MITNSSANTNDNPGVRRKYGPAALIVANMLLEIKEKNKDDQVADLIDRCCEIAIGQQELVDKCSFPETELQAKVAAETKDDEKAASGLAMLSGNLEGNFLKMTAEMLQAKSILEIGMYTGYSAVTLAESAYCEELVTLDLEPYYESFVKSRLAGTSLENKVRIMIGPAEESLVDLKEEGKKFDFVFLDADKAGYLKYYKYIMDNGMLTSNGTIACDNVLWYGRTFNQADQTGKILYEFVEFVKNDDRVYQMVLPIRDGIMLIKPKVNGSQ